MPKLLLFIILLIFTNSFAQPNASFTLNKTKSCVGDTVILTSTSTSTSQIVNYIWSAQGAVVEAASGSTMQQFKCVFLNPGFYNLGLIVQDINGVADSEFKIDAIEINVLPNIDIQSEFITCKNPFQLSFSTGNSSVGGGITYQWSFQGGSPNSSQNDNIQVNFEGEGSRTISLTVNNSITGCRNIKTESLNLKNTIALFSIPNLICKNESFQLINQSSEETDTWVWSSNVGIFDNISSQNPFISFSETGNQSIQLIATNSSNGCKDSITQIVNVLELPSPSFTTNTLRGCSPMSISFTNTSSPMNGASFIWDFGDGSPVNTSTNPGNHTYIGNNIIFTPSFTMTGQNGCKNSFVGDAIYLLKPEAFFKFNNIDGCEPVVVSFLDETISFVPISSWKWDFDDGTSSTLQNPTHTFYCGEYNVRLIVQTPNGCVDTVKMTDFIINYPESGGISLVPDLIEIEIENQEVIQIFEDVNTLNNSTYDKIYIGNVTTSNFEISQQIQCASQSIDFITNPPECNGEEIFKYVWYNYHFEGFNFDSVIPSAIAYTPTYSHVFKDTLRSNTFMDVGLIINFRGCLSEPTYKQDLIYLQGPVSRPELSNKLFCNLGEGPFEINVNDQNSIYSHTTNQFYNGTQISYSQQNDDIEVEYNWGDGTTTLITNDALLDDSDKGSTSHFYSGYGTYIFTQYIRNLTNGCLDSKSYPIDITFIEPNLLFNIEGEDDSLCLFQPYTFYENSNTHSEHNILNYSFHFYDTTYMGSTLNTPNGVFPLNSNRIEDSAGVYNIKLIVSNSVGCMDSTFNSLTIFDLPIAKITLIDDTVCKNSSAKFSPSSSILTGYQEGWNNFLWSYSDNSPNDTTSNINENLSHLIDNSLEITLHVEDGFGCKSLEPDKKTIFGQKPIANFTSNQYLCNNVNELLDGSISQGIGNLYYQWFLDDIAVGNNNDSLLNTINISPPELLFKDYTYKLVVIDDKLCTDTLERIITVSNPKIISVDTTISAKYIDINGNFSCPPVVVDFEINYESNWSFDEFNWSFGNDFNTDIDSQNENPFGIQYVRAGNYDYFVQVREAVTGCRLTHIDSGFLLIGGPSATIKITADSTDICNLRFLFEVLDASDNLDHWTWDLGDGTSVYSQDLNSNSFYHTYLDVNTFEPTIVLYDDETTCAIPISENIEIEENGLNAYFTVEETNISLGENIAFNEQSTSLNGSIILWVWDFGDGVSDTLTSGIDVNHIYLTEQNPTVILTITNEFGCTDQYFMPLELDVNILFPNIITNPGGNGQNSNFVLFANIFKDFEIIILNRWGNVIYEGKRDPINPLFLWAGIDQKSGKYVNSGAYFFVIKGDLIDDRKIVFQDYLHVVSEK
jgi:PKD repeat protein